MFVVKELRVVCALKMTKYWRKGNGITTLISYSIQNKTTNEDKRKEHQKELGKRLNEAARERLADQTGQKDIKKIKKSNISYKSFEKFPKEAEVDKLQIYVGKLAVSLVDTIISLISFGPT